MSWFILKYRILFLKIYRVASTIFRFKGHISKYPDFVIKFERDFVESKNIKKLKKLTTGYIGRFYNDNKYNALRNASEVVDLWRKENIGDLYVFEGKNTCTHLELLCKLKSFHFNLLYWEPKSFHRYYTQNKPFLAAILGIPTIIKSNKIGNNNTFNNPFTPPKITPKNPAIGLNIALKQSSILSLILSSVFFYKNFYFFIKLSNNLIPNYSIKLGICQGKYAYFTLTLAIFYT